MAAIIGEIGLRLIGFSYVNFDKPDSLRGNSLRPNLAGWQTEEGGLGLKSIATDTGTENGQKQSLAGFTES